MQERARIAGGKGMGSKSQVTELTLDWNVGQSICSNGRLGEDYG